MGTLECLGLARAPLAPCPFRGGDLDTFRPAAQEAAHALMCLSAAVLGMPPLLSDRAAEEEAQQALLSHSEVIRQLTAEETAALAEVIRQLTAEETAALVEVLNRLYATQQPTVALTAEETAMVLQWWVFALPCLTAVTDLSPRICLLCPALIAFLPSLCLPARTAPVNQRAAVPHWRRQPAGRFLGERREQSQTLRYTERAEAQKAAERTEAQKAAERAEAQKVEAQKVEAEQRRQEQKVEAEQRRQKVEAEQVQQKVEAEQRRQEQKVEAEQVQQEQKDEPPRKRPRLAPQSADDRHTAMARLKQKQCTACKQLLDVTGFGAKGGELHGRAECKKCNCKRSKESRDGSSEGRKRTRRRRRQGGGTPTPNPKFRKEWCRGSQCL